MGLSVALSETNIYYESPIDVVELKKYVLRISEFFEPIEGDITGRCIICGFDTDKGHTIQLSDNFTAWNLLQEGKVICEYCYPLLKNQDYRRKSWIATSNGVKFLKREDILPILLDPPVPFAMYITKTGKKQGFLHLINRVNYSRDRYFIAFDDELIFVERGKLEEMVKLAQHARKLGFSKSDLISPSTKRWKHREMCEKILELSGNPVWQVVVYAIR